jgi:hypothetical protein
LLSEAGPTSNQLRALQDQNSPDAQALNAKVQTLFRGETLRGLMLTSYGFSIFGDRAQTAAYVCYVLAFVLLLAAIAGYVHAASKKADRQILAPSSTDQQSGMRSTDQPSVDASSAPFRATRRDSERPWLTCRRHGAPPRRRPGAVAAVARGDHISGRPSGDRR